MRRDLEAWKSSAHPPLAEPGAPGLAARTKALDAESDLEFHVEEKDLVFSKIKKTLEKSTTANSLKVFSRSSAKEKVQAKTSPPWRRTAWIKVHHKLGEVLSLFRDEGPGMPVFRNVAN